MLAAAFALGCCALVPPAFGSEGAADPPDPRLPTQAAGDPPGQAEAPIEDDGPPWSDIALPTGTAWQPSLGLRGSLRAALLATDGDRRTRRAGDLSELRTRMDLFADLRLGETERIHAHLRPLDKKGRYAGTAYAPAAARSGWETEWDSDFEALYVEGRLGRAVPLPGLRDRESGEVGFAAGRLPVRLQDGYLVRDDMSALRLAQAGIGADMSSGSSGLRFAGLWAFDDINRPTGRADKRDVDALVLSAEGSSSRGTLALGIGGAFSGGERGDQVNAGVGWSGGSAGESYAVHANVSNHYDQSGASGAVGDFDGVLLAAEYATAFGTHRHRLYGAGFWAEGDFGRLADDGRVPPLAPVGLSFAGVGFGAYRSALWSRPLDAAGAALGVQLFFDARKTDWTVELAHRSDLEPGDAFGDTGGSALNARLRHRLLDGLTVQADAYHAILEGDAGPPQDAETDDDSSAARIELRIDF